MTQVQKIIASVLGVQKLERGTRVYLKKNGTLALNSAVSFDDTLCGAYGSVYIKDEIFPVPGGVFIDLCGALGNDTDSERISDFFKTNLENEKLFGLSVEIGGDSMSYLTMEDRLAVVKALNGLLRAPLCTVFECDYITAEYMLEHFGKKPTAFFNDGPQSYEKILQLNLGLV